EHLLRVGDRAQDERADHLVHRVVGQRDGLRPGAENRQGYAGGRRTPAQPLVHAEAWLDGVQVGALGQVAEVGAGAGPGLEHRSGSHARERCALVSVADVIEVPGEGGEEPGVEATDGAVVEGEIVADRCRLERPAGGIGADGHSGFLVVGVIAGWAGYSRSASRVAARWAPFPSTGS